MTAKEIADGIDLTRHFDFTRGGGVEILRSYDDVRADIAAALQSYGDERAREALERAAQAMNQDELWEDGKDAAAVIRQLPIEVTTHAKAMKAERDALRLKLSQATYETLELILKETNTPIDVESGETPFDVLRRALAERDTLREQVAGHCERIAKQSELLTQRACVAAMEGKDGRY